MHLFGALVPYTCTNVTDGTTQPGSEGSASLHIIITDS